MEDAVAMSSATSSPPARGTAYAIDILYVGSCPRVNRTPGQRGTWCGPAMRWSGGGERAEGLANGVARHVVDDSERADLGSEDKRDAAITRLLVAAHRVHDGVGRGAEAAHGQSYGAEQRDLPRRRVLGGDAEPLCDAGLRHHPERDGLAVCEPPKTRGRFERMTDRVAIVEDVAQFGFLLVALD